MREQQGRRVPIPEERALFSKLGGFLGHASILPRKSAIEARAEQAVRRQEKGRGINLSPQVVTIRPTPAVHLAHARPRTRPRKTFT